MTNTDYRNKVGKVNIENGQALNFNSFRLELSFAPGMCLNDLLIDQGICYKKMGVAFIVNDKLQQTSYKLNDGDLIKVLPLITGG